jgi:DNA replication protein DnaC
MSDVCEKCDGVGMVLAINADGERVARVCSCQEPARGGNRLASAHIPPRYQHCTLESFETGFPNADPSLQRAVLMTQGFIRDFPFATDGRGLLYTGSIGVGKTHLAVGTLRALIEERGATGLFCDYRELLKQIQHSYNPQVNSTELDILKPVFEAEVLVLDELGAQKPTDWVWDTVALILNTRYNEKRTTIITSNYPDAAPAGSKLTATQQAVREDSLGDRIGERMRSRLAEMCGAIVMQGKDFRQVKRASFVLYS